MFENLQTFQLLLVSVSFHGPARVTKQACIVTLYRDLDVRGARRWGGNGLAEWREAETQCEENRDRLTGRKKERESVCVGGLGASEMG